MKEKKVSGVVLDLFCLNLKH